MQCISTLLKYYGLSGDVRNFTDVRSIRASVLYRNDQAKVIRKSHENPAIKKLYEEYLGEPGSKKAHETLHTTYVKRTSPDTCG